MVGNCDNGLSPSDAPTSDTTPTASPPSSSNLNIEQVQDSVVQDAMEGSDVEDPYDMEEDSKKVPSLVSDKEANGDDEDSRSSEVPVPRRASQSSPTLHIAQKKGTAVQLRAARRFQPPRLWSTGSGLLDVGNGSKLRDMLLSPEAWDCLTPADKEAILALLPQRYRLYGAPDVEALSNDDNFRNDCAHYYDSIAEGHLTETWLKKSWRAHLKSKRGDFKEHLQHAFEDKFLAHESDNGDGKKTATETAEHGDKMDLDNPNPADDNKAKGDPDKIKKSPKNGSPTLS